MARKQGNEMHDLFCGPMLPANMQRQIAGGRTFANQHQQDSVPCTNPLQLPFILRRPIMAKTENARTSLPDVSNPVKPAPSKTNKPARPANERNDKGDRAKQAWERGK